MQPFSFFFVGYSLGGGGGISGRVRALNLTVPLGSGRVGSDNLGYGPGSGFSFEPVQTSNADPPPLQPLQRCWQHSYIYFPNTTSGYETEQMHLLWSTMVRPVLSGTCPVKPLYGLGHRAAAQFQGLQVLAIFL